MSQLVLTLDASTFRHFISKDSLMLVAYTAPWCGHCVSLKEELKVAAFTLFAENVQVR
jgi:thiol-disulfide isomerase/thioredoxin